MTKQKILNSKEIKKINKVLEERFGVTLPKERVYLMSEKDRLYISTRMIELVDTDNIRVNSFGIYVLTMKDNTLRLSIEGSQLLGPSATKNVIILDHEDVDDWMKGQDLECSPDIYGIFIIATEAQNQQTNNIDFMGSGFAKGGKIINYVPKERRITRRD